LHTSEDCILTFVTGADSWRAAIISLYRREVIMTKKLLALIFGGLFFLLSTSAQPLPQTARQALLEMFFSKTPGTFEKHLPQATRAALRKAGASGPSMLDGFSAITTQLSVRGQQLQTIEAGPILISIEDPVAHTKFEITVERDDLRGDEDEIELSFHGYKDGETQTAGTKVRFTFTMKQEAGSWRLNEVTVAVGVSLTDPAFLKAMETGMKATSASGQMSASAPSTLAAMSATNEASAVGGVRMLNTAEVTYAAAYPTRGFTCVLSDLGGMGGGAPNEHQAMLIDPRLAGGKKNGYVFALSGCNGNPAYRYSISAMPADPSSGTRAFCSDESAVIRSSPDGKAGSCLSAGKPLQ
jgi:type IV pilus assembly protein PilA